MIDVVAVLTDSVNPANYWKVLKNRLKKEGNETVTNCNRLKLRAEDGKMRLTDVATAEQMFRIIQSIPSPKAEPFKVWMAKVAAERLDQLQDPELSIQQALADYRRLGYTEKWIARRAPQSRCERGQRGAKCEKHCEWCGSSSYGSGCIYSPDRKHRHGPGANKCIWCGSTSNGSGCLHSPTGKHEK